MHSIAAVLGIAGLLAMPGLAAAGGEQAGSDLQRFLDWFPGEYDNYAQVWQQELDGAEHMLEHLHHIFASVSVPAVGDNIFFVQQYLDGDPKKVYRQRLYKIDLDDEEQAIRLTIFSFRDEQKYLDAYLQPAILAGLSSGDLIARPGCEVYWTFVGDHFKGYMKERACNFVSERSGKKIFITDDLRLTKDEIWIRDEAFDADGNRIFGNVDGIHHKNRKVRYFTGWGGVKIAGPGAAEDDDEWHFLPQFVIHNEGQIVPIVGKEGQLSGYSIQLAFLTYQNTSRPVLKLGLIDDKTGKTISYSWANPDAEMIGLNLRWAQVGLRLKQTGTAFGYTIDQ
ncbi:MAG: hypothetical protein GY916_06670 [Gammaproteobacteria bacterium]|nr:hypothetical protein [Gammaproteobacteria bacterium]